MAVAQRILDEGRTIPRAAAQGEVDADLLHELHLLTVKPFIYVFNVDEDALSDTELAEGLAESVVPASSIVLCAQIEEELARLSPRGRQGTPRGVTGSRSRDWNG